MTIQSSVTPQSQTEPTLHNELILVVKRSELFAQEPAWSGLKQASFDPFLATITRHKEFLPRWQMEGDPAYKQIIPYLIFTHQDRYFLMQRQAQATERRLQNKYSLGIGGHIRQEDMTTDSIIEWAKREFHEEVAYEGTVKVTPFGILNDDSNSVGQVHIGFVFLLEGDSSQISVKSELKSGQLMTIEEIEFHISNLESWSQIVFETLKIAKK